LLIDVFKKLQYERLNVILLIIGDDTDTNQPTLKKYLSIKPENVFFLGPQNNISDYLFLVNYFCLSSKFEGLPISLIEAISHELPLIATNVGGISELIFDNQNGILVNSMEVNEYYDKIIELLNWDIEKLDKVKKFNKELYQSKFTIEANVRAHLKLYNS